MRRGQQAGWRGVKESFERTDRCCANGASLARNFTRDIVAAMSPRVWLPSAVVFAAAFSFVGCGKPREPEPFRGSTGAAPQPPPPPATAPAPANPSPSSAPAGSASAAPKPAEPTAPGAEPKKEDASLRGYVRNLSTAPVIAGKTIDDASLNRAVQQFGAMEGRLPKNLEELVTEKYLPEIPKAPAGHRIDYDPLTGKVTVVRVNP